MTLDNILTQCSKNYKLAIKNIDFEQLKKDKILIATAKEYMTLGLEYLYTISNINQTKEYYCMYNIYQVKNKKYYDPILKFYIDLNNKVLVLTNYQNTYMNIEYNLTFNDKLGYLNVCKMSYKYNILFKAWIKDLQYQKMFVKLKKIQINKYDNQIIQSM